MYFGGPIFDKLTSTWQATFYTRSNGDVVGAAESQIGLPFNMDTIVRSACSMKSVQKSQSGFWVGPRLILSTLHFHNWMGAFATNGEVEMFRQQGVSFAVENEVSQEIVGEFSPRVQLVAFDTDNDIGLFKLQDQYPNQTNYIDYNWLLDRDELCQLNIPHSVKAACIGYSGKLSDEDARIVENEAAKQLGKALSQSVGS